jgi:hypothetical protein
VTWSYGFTGRAQRDLDDINDADRRLIYEALDRFAADPFSSHICSPGHDSILLS